MISMPNWPLRLRVWLVMAPKVNAVTSDCQTVAVYLSQTGASGLVVRRPYVTAFALALPEAHLSSTVTSPLSRRSLCTSLNGIQQ